jgi:predicted TPR repeat methyltransferase
MPPSCCQPDYDAIFNDKAARRELADYRRSGPTGTTRRLIEAITASGVDGARVLDIGGGVGVIGVELLAAGAASLTGVDASRAYVAAARSEIERRGFGSRAAVRNADFVEVSTEVEAADVVTLDRVVCCYGDWVALVDRSVERSRRLYGLVYPNERWWMRIIVATGNLVLRLFRQSFHFYLHPERSIDARVRAAGFERRHHHRGWLWQTVLYERASASSPR